MRGALLAVPAARACTRAVLELWLDFSPFAVAALQSRTSMLAPVVDASPFFAPSGALLSIALVVGRVQTSPCRCHSAMLSPVDGSSCLGLPVFPSVWGLPP